MNSKGPTVTTGMVNTGDFYLLTNEELPQFSGLVKKEKRMFKGDDIILNMGAGTSFLLPLVSSLLKDARRIRKLQNSLEEVYDPEKKVERVIQNFLEVVKEWLEENGGRGNLLQLTEALQTNGHIEIAQLLEQLFLHYSLPMSAKDENGQDNNVYSLSTDCPSVNQAFKKRKRVISEELEEVCELQVQASEKDILIGGKNGIAMSSHVKMVELDRNRQGTANRSNYKLTKQPFRYKLSYDHPYSGRDGTPFFCGSVENKFWELCGAQIEDLQIDRAMFDLTGDDNLYRTCERLLLHTCQNLKKLTFSESCEIIRNTEGGADSRRNAFARKQNIADNLRSLTIEVETTAENLEKIFYICPKIKTLDLFLFEEKINGLLRPTATGEYIKLEYLTMHYPVASQVDKFIELRDYTKLLADKQFNSLKHLHVDGIFLSDARSPPFHLYAALANCSNSLKSLSLIVHVAETDLSGGREWFNDLTSFSFPNLTVLKLRLEFVQFSPGQKNMKFDFRTLKGMQMLEQLEIGVVNNDAFQRSPATQDWICKGDRNNYLPCRVALDYSIADRILCNNLRKFTFKGWALNKEDIPLVSGWFPNLTQLVAKVNPDTVPLLLENWKKLEIIEMKTERLISLRELRPLKEKNKQLRIIQTIYWPGGLRRLVEVKETNGMLYFQEGLADEVECMFELVID